MDFRPAPYNICKAAIRLFATKGFENATMVEIAEAASCSEEELYTYFGRKHDIILFLYGSINSDWQHITNEQSTGNLAERFRHALMAKIELVDPYTTVLVELMGMLLQNNKIGVSSTRTSHIREQGLQTIQKIINGATDNEFIKKNIPQLPHLLYLLHWSILFLHMYVRDKNITNEAIKLAENIIHFANKYSLFLKHLPLMNEIGLLAGKVINIENQVNKTVDREILKVIFNHRKITEADRDCIDNNCETCINLHIGKVKYFISQNKPVHFILPAFPAKSPNHAKVLGAMPDLGEEIALSTLEDMCREIKSIYDPGAHITICSDGRIFSELVEVTDDEISNYVQGIKVLIKKLQLQHINIVNLEDLLEGGTFEYLRNQVLDKYAEQLEELKIKIKSDETYTALFNGMHRFISDDRKVLYPLKSVNKIKEESKLIALKVIQHSNAWTRFLSYVYPESVRLSIHPYPAHHDKIGVQLTKAIDNWITPWHGVIVLQENGYVLMKRSQAEEKGARLVIENNQPKYYTLIPE